MSPDLCCLPAGDDDLIAVVSAIQAVFMHDGASANGFTGGCCARYDWIHVNRRG
ncbi:hypothetical protein [Novipirellula sp.]|uniref:hypothetical protein n=1 Tax=Novipirellula sp. TaxID=2795430 RepID=UPI003567B92C